MSDPDHKKSGISRRTFIKGLGISSLGAATLQGGGLKETLQEVGLLQKEHIIGREGVEVTFFVNGEKRRAHIEPCTTLAEVLRNQFGLTGTKLGCERGACGACTVLLNGKAVSSCMILAVDAVGATIQTIEGLEAKDGTLHPLQEAFIEHDAMQCGFCTSGMIMSGRALLDINPAPEGKEIREAVSGNLCRCGTYPHVFKAIQAAGKKSTARKSK